MFKFFEEKYVNLLAAPITAKYCQYHECFVRVLNYFASLASKEFYHYTWLARPQLFKKRKRKEKRKENKKIKKYDNIKMYSSLKILVRITQGLKGIIN